jgi:hypothetical protein
MCDMDRLLPAKLTMIAGLWAATGAWAATEGTKAPPAVEPAPPDPIAEAKRQFEAIRNQRRELVGDADLKLNIAPPPLPTDQPLPRPLRAASSLDAAKAAAQKTWLFDAMRQPGKADEKSRRSGGEEAATTDDFGFEKKPAERAESAPRDSRAKAPTAPVFDPLRDYLAAWMTPADYALLVKPAKDRQEAALGTDFAVGLPPLAMLGGRTNPDLRTGADVSPALVDLAPRENPYLKTSQSSTTAFGPANNGASTFNGAQPETKPPVPASALTPDYTNPTQPVTPPALPDRLKPADDRKYFPQLKRF